MLRRAPQPKLRAEATALPFPDESIAAVALRYVLYHLARPEHSLAEAHRVLRRRGLVAVATPSRYDTPELAHYLPSLPLTFDAERAAELVAAVFDDVEIETWDGPFLELPTKAAGCDYLIGKGVEQTTAHAGAGEVKVPLLVTKRGALVFARKR
jgi:SAM-dependent methyltransferase